MATDGGSSTQKPVRGCQTFADGRSVPHVLVYVGGVALWIGVYVALVFGLGASDQVATRTPAGLYVRQVGATVAGVVTGVYFAGAYTRALGAPMPDLVAASAVGVLMPARVLALGAAPPDPALVGSDLLVSTVVLSSGSAVTLVLVLGWYYVRFGGTGTEDAERWEDDHFPPGFRLAVAGTGSGGVDWAASDYGLGEWSYGRFLRHGAVVLVGGILLYGVVLAGRLAVGGSVLLQSLEETPLVSLTIAGIVYVWWLNRRWRAASSN